VSTRFLLVTPPPSLPSFLPSILQVITELGVPVLEDWSQQGGRALQAVADALLRHATPLHVSVATKLNAVSSM
jgi:hypothetical protein